MGLDGSLSLWHHVHLEDNLPGRSSKPWPPNAAHTFQSSLQRPPLFCCSWAPIKSSQPAPSPPSRNSFQMRIEFLCLFFQSVYVIICKSYQKWSMRHRRGTHTQFNEVFTDNSNCQILVPNDIVQSADAHNRLSLSLQLAAFSLSRQI